MSRHVLHPATGLASLAALLLLAPAASADHIAGATYSGPAAPGGSVSFDVASDGSSVTRFQVTDVPTSCGAVSSTSSGAFAITDHAFQSVAVSGLRFAGSFPAPQQAQGTLSLKIAFPSCTSADVPWSATTTAQPPAPPPTPPPGPSPAPAPTPTPAPTADSTPPELRLGGRTRQRLGRSITVRAVCPTEACDLVTTGLLAVPGLRKPFKLGPVTRSLAAGGSAVVRLRLSAVARRSALRALRNGRRVTATVRATATDAVGNRTPRTRRVRLLR